MIWRIIASFATVLTYIMVVTWDDPEWDFTHYLARFGLITTGLVAALYAVWSGT